MSLKRWDAKRDANEGPIVQALERVGAKVLRLDPFDLLVWRQGLYMLDVKSPGGKPTATQAQLVADGWPLVYVQDPIGALKAIGAVKK